MLSFFVPASELLHATFERFFCFKKLATMFQTACELYEIDLGTLGSGPQRNSRLPNDQLLKLTVERISIYHGHTTSSASKMCRRIYIICGRCEKGIVDEIIERCDDWKRWIPCSTIIKRKYTRPKVQRRWCTVCKDEVRFADGSPGSSKDPPNPRE